MLHWRSTHHTRCYLPASMCAIMPTFLILSNGNDMAEAGDDGEGDDAEAAVAAPIDLDI